MRTLRRPDAALIEALNPDDLAAAVRQRVLLHRLAAAAGLPVPVLHGVIGRAGGWNVATGRVLASRAQAAQFLAEDAPDEFALRPGLAGGSVGARVVRREDRVLIDLAGCARTTPAALTAAIWDDPVAELFLVQERLAPHPGLAAGWRGIGLPAVRLTTFVAADGAEEVVHAALDPAARAGPARVVDVQSGRLGDGTQVPGWPAALDLARTCARLVMPQRCLRWVIALTPNGPVLLDADLDRDPETDPGLRAALERLPRELASADV